MQSNTFKVAIIGGGPAGLMAAETLSERGISVDLYDAMPSVGRKFLLAGKGGMNLTHSEALPAFTARYRERATQIEAWLQDFGPDQLRTWADGLGIPTFVGSSGRVFPVDMKAAPLLRAWLHRLRERGVKFHMRHRWTGWSEAGALCFKSPDGQIEVAADATIMALGGASWARLGSDGAWVTPLSERGVPVRPLVAANCGFDVAWSEVFRTKYAGSPLKSIALSVTDKHGQTHRRKGECVVSEHGLEGSVVYALSAEIRDAIDGEQGARIFLDLAPDWSIERVQQEISHPRGARSMSNHLQSRVHISGVKAGLLREGLARESFNDPTALAAGIKALPLTALRARPIDEVISSAGGVEFEGCDERLMLRALPGVFCAGEMLDWEAPTGGYLLTACFASGRAAGVGVVNWLENSKP